MSPVSVKDGLQVPLAFASREQLDPQELRCAPLRWPRPSRLEAELDVAPPRAKAALDGLGLRTWAALAAHLPREHRALRPIAELTLGEPAALSVQVRSIRARTARRRRLHVLEATVADDSGSLRATFFNQPWLGKRYTAGSRLFLEGKLEGDGRFQVSAHALGGEETAAEDGQFLGRYPAAEGISSAQIQMLVRALRPLLADVPEALPAELRIRERLPERAAALDALHFPSDRLAVGEGRRRLAFEELLELQLRLLRRRSLRAARSRAHPIGPPGELTRHWLAHTLPFAPTADQRAAMEAIDRDLAGSAPMQRLLMGEVGSGKTIVALYAMLRAFEHGLQAVLMAPTETLAEQHFRTLAALLPDTMTPVELLTGSLTARRRADVLSKLGSGACGLVVGTHALIEHDVVFDRLAVVVVDEEHRFGVRQRSALDRKGPAGPGASLVPHVLHMTATPIPRTLALTRFGDLDRTELRELPSDRRPVSTSVASTEAERARAYERVRTELRAGRQAFVVCPLVEESEQLQARAASAEHARLAAGELRDFRVVLVHGQMPARERQLAMEAFARGEAQVLVATTVIEVGVDVPNATVMLVEDAERYGISQLHQLRGRIGRGAHESLCVLFGTRRSPRLEALGKHRDGFVLAEIDLRLRGEGDAGGVRQSGLPEFQFASLPEDGALLESARRWARTLLERDPELSLPEHGLIAAARVPEQDGAQDRDAVATCG